MGVILGKKVLIYSGATGTTPVVAAAKNCSINIKYDMIEKASSTQSTAKEFITGRYEWELTVGHLVVSGSEYQGIRLAGQRVLISVVINNVRKKGYVIVPQAGISAPVNGLATGSVTFKGDGEFDINT